MQVLPVLYSYHVTVFYGSAFARFNCYHTNFRAFKCFFVPSNQLISTELPKSIYVEPFQTNIFRGTSDKMAQSSLQFTNELSTANAIIVQMFCLIVPLSVGFNVHPRGIWCEQTLTHSPEL